MLKILMVLSVSCCLDLSSARPAEESTRFSLYTIKNDNKNILSSTLEQGKELLGRIVDATRIGRGRLVNSIVLIRNVIADQAEQLSKKASSNLTATVTTSDKPNRSRRSLTSIQTTTPIVLFPPVQRETVRLENNTAQAILEKPTPDNARQLLNSFLNPTPIVDGIKEEDKYGNTGDKFIGVGRAIVNAYENLSNFLNTVVDLPVHAVKQTSRGITETLNQIGARLIGLQ
ncbi:uncharacterized protein LOC116845225 isoform X1 [Odontomachus brunneus]|uniref:uncharacterized protein LOC116845225 isoform X1 n=1 Tax=Odontomachus brunneus TaxID=486640 RepID=UPI0013F29802|nr:uncharacterized protein LOC116845225 isoform X1 [Odontomachus brunneus]